MTQQMIIANQSKDKSLGRWEYDIKNDKILLNDGAAHIYYNEAQEKSVNVEEFFSILSAKSSQRLSHVLTDISENEAMFFQNVCTDGQTKKVLVIMLNNNSMSENRQGLSVDVTKIL